VLERNLILGTLSDTATVIRDRLGRPGHWPLLLQPPLLLPAPQSASAAVAAPANTGIESMRALSCRSRSDPPAQ
jgi:hypothetical protein